MAKIGKKNNGKNENEEAALENLLGFARKGARAKNYGNIPTGHFDLDFAIHYGMLPQSVDLKELEGYNPSDILGLPMGRSIEIFGHPACGKSSLAYRVVGMAQKLGHKCLWIDTEHSFVDDLAEKVNGVDLEKLYYSELFDQNDPDKDYHAEDILDKIIDACKAGFKVIVLDSVANLIPKKRLESDSSQALVAALPRVLGENYGKVNHYVSKYGVCMILINQIRIKVGTYMGNPEDSGGGFMFKHSMSVRIKMTKRESVEKKIFRETENGEQEVIGSYAGVQLVKNRMGRPLLDSNGKKVMIELPVYYKAYFPNIEEIVFDAGRKMKIITIRNGVYKWGDIAEKGRTAFIEAIKDANVVEKMANEIKVKAEDNNVLLPPEFCQAHFGDKKVLDDEPKKTTFQTKAQKTKKKD